LTLPVVTKLFAVELFYIFQHIKETAVFFNSTLKGLKGITKETPLSTESASPVITIFDVGAINTNEIKDSFSVPFHMALPIYLSSKFFSILVSLSSR
jgi:hypothetical protein